VILDIDGRNVTNLSFAAAANQGLTQQNPYGLVLLQSATLKTFTIGFPTPLLYERSLTLGVTVLPFRERPWRNMPTGVFRAGHCLVLNGRLG
jgi:hypothetical protein